MCRHLRICHNIRPHTYMPASCISNESLETSSPPWPRILMVNSVLWYLSWPYAHATLLPTQNTTLLYNVISQSSRFPAPRWNLSLQKTCCCSGEYYANELKDMISQLATTRPPTPMVTCNLCIMYILQFNVICCQDGITISSYCVIHIIDTSPLVPPTCISSFTRLCV